jgi:hypothetical protein
MKKLRAFVFNDRNGAVCSIRKCPIGPDAALNLNIDQASRHPGLLRITQDQVKGMLPMLQRFAETGELTCAD